MLHAPGLSLRWPWGPVTMPELSWRRGPTGGFGAGEQHGLLRVLADWRMLGEKGHREGVRAGASLGADRRASIWSGRGGKAEAEAQELLQRRSLVDPDAGWTERAGGQVGRVVPPPQGRGAPAGRPCSPLASRSAQQSRPRQVPYPVWVLGGQGHPPTVGRRPGHALVHGCNLCARWPQGPMRLGSP